MKALLLSAVVILSGCASMKWGHVMPGQTSEEVVQIMGAPSNVYQTKEGPWAFEWYPDHYSACGVTFDAENRVVQKKCIVDAAARAQTEAAENDAAMRFFQQSQQFTQSLYTPPKTTNCTTNRIGTAAYTNCSSN